MELTTKQIQPCNGRVRSNGYCEKCGMPSQSSSAYCTRYYEVDYKHAEFGQHNPNFKEDYELRQNRR